MPLCNPRGGACTNRRRLLRSMTFFNGEEAEIQPDSGNIPFWRWSYDQPPWRKNHRRRAEQGAAAGSRCCMRLSQSSRWPSRWWRSSQWCCGSVTDQTRAGPAVIGGGPGRVLLNSANSVPLLWRALSATIADRVVRSSQSMASSRRSIRSLRPFTPSRSRNACAV
jgi:hypothetical protein